MRRLLLPLLIASAFNAHAASPADHFDYQHQAEWHAVHDAFQSPIDIHTVDAVAVDEDEPDAVQPHYGTLAGMVVDTGHALQVNVPGGDAKIRGRRFMLRQFHFHAHSEHTIDGKSFPAEVHLVHVAKDGRMAVIGVMLEEGAANPALDAVLKAARKGEAHEVPAVAPADLLPKRDAYYHYLGSLTTPPLTENVEWYVLKQPITASRAQLDALRGFYADNFRAPQPLEGRVVTQFDPAPLKK
ncbi:carbonic anhydrase [Ralstonia sp. 24A2]|uniref:carbonic anhydrase n=1 Tax=Ralstonia sp. 24A2 TaxID=3447364 RepID=UPI003F69DEF0